MNIANIEYNVTQASENEFILSFKEANYLIGEVVYILLKGLKQGENISSITNTIKSIDGYDNITTNDVNSLIENKIQPLLSQETVTKKENPVKSLGVLFRPKEKMWAFQMAKNIFSPTFFWITYTLLLTFSISLIFIEDNILGSLGELRYGWIFTLLFSFFVIFFHELGHVTAAIRYKIVPKKVGFGVYFIYPAFYTDLSEIWKLHKNKRIIINLGGMYFQMLLNVILFALMILYPSEKPLWISMIFSNMSIMFFNFNPLFKFDGYWVLSDFFELPNLRDQGNRVLLSFIKKATFPEVNKTKKIVLIIYSVSFLVFMVFIWTMITRFLYTASVAMYQEFAAFGFARFTEFETIRKVLFFVFILVLATRMIFKTFFSKKKA